MLTLPRLCAGALCLMMLGGDPTRIAFASNRDGNWEIYTSAPDGTDHTRLTRRGGQDRFPLWSPDRSKIAFGSETGSGWELWVMNADGTSTRKLATRIS